MKTYGKSLEEHLSSVHDYREQGSATCQPFQLRYRYQCPVFPILIVTGTEFSSRHGHDGTLLRWVKQPVLPV